MSNTQEAYIQTLKQIKNAEDLAEKEINEHIKECERIKKDLQLRIERDIEAAKAQGEKLVATSVENARNKAISEASTIVRDAENRAKMISAQSNAPSINKVMDIVLRGIE